MQDILSILDGRIVHYGCTVQHNPQTYLNKCKTYYPPWMDISSTMYVLFSTNHRYILSNAGHIIRLRLKYCPSWMYCSAQTTNISNTGHITYLGWTYHPPRMYIYCSPHILYILNYRCECIIVNRKHTDMQSTMDVLSATCINHKHIYNCKPIDLVHHRCAAFTGFEREELGRGRGRSKGMRNQKEKYESV